MFIISNIDVRNLDAARAEIECDTHYFNFNDGNLEVELMPNEITALVRQLRAAFPREFAEAVDPTHVSRFESPDVIPGYDTVVGWVSKNRPDIIENMGTQAWLHTRDGFWLSAQARKRDLKVHKVRAPEVLQQQGIEEVNAYPVGLIAERFDE